MKFLSFLTLFVLLMQPFTYGFYKALCWQFEGRLKKRGRRLLCLALFAFGNSLIILSLFRLWHGSFRLTALWMVLLLYTGFAALFVWLLKLLLRQRVADETLRRILRIAAPAAVASLFCLSLYNAYLPTVRHYRVVLDKPLAKPLRIGVASDLHLGILFGARQLDKLAGIMQQEKADIILLPGDIMDDDTAAYEAEHMQPHLSKLRAPLGVYATLGNHDLFGAQRQITRAIEAAGITVLNDGIIETGELTVIGRPDDLDRGRLKSGAASAAAFHIDNQHFRLRSEPQRDAPEAVAGSNEKVAVADFFISVVQAVDGADDEVGRKNLAVVDVAGNLDVDGQG